MSKSSRVRGRLSPILPPPKELAILLDLSVRTGIFNVVLCSAWRNGS